MRLDNLTLKAVSFAALATFSAAALALTPPPPEAPIAAASSPSIGKSVTSAAVSAIPMGTANPYGDQAKKAIGTIAELEELQRQAALAEVRKRLQESGGAPASSAQAPSQSATAARPSAPAPKPVKVIKRKVEAPVVRAPMIQFDPILMNQPKAKLVSVLVVGGRARADVIDEGRIVVIKEGDKLSGWTVVRISADGVTMEYRYSTTMARPTTPPGGTGFRPAVAEAFTAAYEMVNSQPSMEEVDQVKTITMTLATPLEIAAITSMPVSATGAPLPPALPKVPQPLGNSGLVDSTSVPAVPPLPQAFGNR